MRTQTIKFSEFMTGEYKVKAKAKKERVVRNTVKVASSAILPIVSGGTVGTLGLVFATGSVLACGTSAGGGEAIAVAGVSQAVGESAMRTLGHALDPLIDILVAISLPVASVIMVGGCFFFMLGNSEKAWSMIQNAGLGFCLIQLSPLFIKMLEQVGKAI
ncbi:hypothetical protein [Peribacillus sp. YIM B13477]|uniref:hypothetical protein n=1 Tax=Peribacillus sp. YIM B13477 TaxID=3366300 RepID=UPI00366B69CD